MKNLLLLHGALGAKSQFTELENTLQKNFNVYSINFKGHGGSPIPNSPFSMKMFAEDVLKWLEGNKLNSINIFGYSMGGYAALYLAKHQPARIDKIFTLATKFKWSEEIANKEVKFLNPDKIKVKIPEFAEELKQRHSPQDWEKILQKTAEMMNNLGKQNELTVSNYQGIEHEVLIGIGDRDKMVTLEESIEVYRRFKNGKLLVLPDTPHPFEQVDTFRLALEIKDFFS